MAQAKLYAANGDFKNEVALPAMFDETVNKVCIYLHVKAILNNLRQGTAQTKTRSQVSGGTTKPWKQKGTGRARSGQNTSPVWVRGNKAHGPKSHDYFEKVNKKVKRIAFHSALSAKALEGKVLVFEALSFEAPKTKDFLSVMLKSGIEQRNARLIVGEKDKNLQRSSANVPWCRCARVADVNTYDLVRANNIVISQAALAELEGGR